MEVSPSIHSQAASAKRARFAEPGTRPKCGKASGDKRWVDIRARLTTATVETVDASDWPSVTLGAVARAYSISILVMYKHFPDGAAPFEAVQEEVSGRLGTLADAAAHESPVDSIFDVGERLIAYSEEHPNLLEFAFFGPSSNSTSAVDAEAGARWELLAFVYRKVGRLVGSQPLPPWRSADGAGRGLFVSLWSFIQGYSKLATSGTVHHRNAFLKAVLRSVLSITTAQTSDEEASGPAEGAQATQAKGGDCANKK